MLIQFDYFIFLYVHKIHLILKWILILKTVETNTQEI